MPVEHYHFPVDLPGVDLPDDFPARGTAAFTYLPGGQVETATWTRPDGTLYESRGYGYNANGTINTITRRLFDIDGTTLLDTLTYTHAYAGTPARVSSIAVT